MRSCVWTRVSEFHASRRAQTLFLYARMRTTLVCMWEIPIVGVRAPQQRIRSSASAFPPRNGQSKGAGIHTLQCRPTEFPVRGLQQLLKSRAQIQRAFPLLNS